jgi:sugar/nucleoside kinase (ribokinase family)
VPFHVLPIGKVGEDEAGCRMLKEMSRAGMDIRYVETVKNQPTLFSVCFQYPDGTGGNLTTSQSAASELTTEDVDRGAAMLVADGSRSMTLAAPEVPLDARLHLLKLATAGHAFRAAAFASSEVRAACQLGMFSLLDLVALNEDEAGMLIGRPFNPEAADAFLGPCSTLLTFYQPGIRITGCGTTARRSLLPW